jgi:hypothetical protein
MDEFADFDGLSGFALSAILLLMATFGCAVPRSLGVGGPF